MDQNYVFKHHLATRLRYLAQQVRETTSPVVLDEIASKLEKVSADIERGGVQ